MLVGIMSDTHDDMERIRAAVEFFNGRETGLVVHAGDLVSPFTFEFLSALACPFAGVFGNNDGDRVLLSEKSGGALRAQPLVLDLGGLRAVVVHEPAAAESLARSGDFEVVVYGHTHEADVRRVGSALVVNPGKTARLHKGRSTLALLDTEAPRAEVVSAF